MSGTTSPQPARSRDRPCHRGRVDLPGWRHGSDHPVIWSHHQGRGRAWYTALGHTAASWSEPRFLARILGGIRWTAGAD